VVNFAGYNVTEEWIIMEAQIKFDANSLQIHKKGLIGTEKSEAAKVAKYLT
jgi:hypothetical protein